jgi:transcriptional regulator with XRE-family HTH domain
MLTWMDSMPIGKDEKAFFARIGARIAQVRKAQNITQAQLAELLGVSQQTITAYEVGRRRMPVSALPTLARHLGVAVEELMGEQPPAARRGPAPKLQQQIERIQQLPRSKQRFVIEMLDTLLQQTAR